MTDVARLLPHDKALHLIAGVIVFAAGNVFHPYLGLALAAGAGLVKELLDWYGKRGTPDGLDLLATATGGALGFVCSL